MTCFRSNAVFAARPMKSRLRDLMANGGGEAAADPRSGAGSRNRTRDLLITNQLLYQLSYAGAGLRF